MILFPQLVSLPKETRVFPWQSRNSGNISKIQNSIAFAENLASPKCVMQSYLVSFEIIPGDNSQRQLSQNSSPKKAIFLWNDSENARCVQELQNLKQFAKFAKRFEKIKMRTAGAHFCASPQPPIVFFSPNCEVQIAIESCRFLTKPSAISETPLILIYHDHKDACSFCPGFSEPDNSIKLLLGLNFFHCQSSKVRFFTYSVHRYGLYCWWGKTGGAGVDGRGRVIKDHESIGWNCAPASACYDTTMDVY